MSFTLRQRLGAVWYDWPRFLRHIGGNWTLIRNRAEVISSDGRGVRCHWQFSSDLHIAKVYPFVGRWLMRRALADWPISFRDEPVAAASAEPRISFLIGHRGPARLSHLLLTLRTIAAQRDVAFECVVVEQSERPEVQSELPSWVRYVHTRVDASLDYCRSATFNAAARLARGQVLVLHDNDMLVPERYGAHLAGLADEGWDFMNLKRFIFYLGEDATRGVFDGGPFDNGLNATVVQNPHGGSVAATARAYAEIGGFDEEFVGWGGEDLEFWERAIAGGRVYDCGFLPFIHLWHAPQKGKEHRDTPGMRRYAESHRVSASERIRKLRAQQPSRG